MILVYVYVYVYVCVCVCLCLCVCVCVSSWQTAHEPTGSYALRRRESDASALPSFVPSVTARQVNALIFKEVSEQQGLMLCCYCLRVRA
jgi:hypothetical protein